MILNKFIYKNNLEVNFIRLPKISNKYIVALGSVVLVLLIILFNSYKGFLYNESKLSKEVFKYKPKVEKYAAEYGVAEYIDYLLAIMQTESAGTSRDVMQSSESLGLEPNTLDTEESIEQGCKYFSQLLQIAEENNCDFNSVIQAYNYGTGYLYYVDSNGGKHSLQLAEQFAKDNSEGVKVDYENPIAIKDNGGWRYEYGNMFYVEIVKQYINDTDIS